MTKKTFDAVAWMRKRRAEIDLEDSGLTWEEKRRKTRDEIEAEPEFRSLVKAHKAQKPHRAA